MTQVFHVLKMENVYVPFEVEAYELVDILSSTLKWSTTNTANFNLLTPLHEFLEQIDKSFLHTTKKGSSVYV